MRSRTGIYIEAGVHAFCWMVGTFLFLQFNALSFHYLKGDLMDIPLLFGTFINALIFYFNLFYLFPRYQSRNIGVAGYILWAVTLLIMLSFAENVFDYQYAVAHYPENNISLQTGEILVTTAFNTFFLLGSVLYAIIRDWIRIEVTQRKLSEENLKLELNYLKSQISPHFLFNTLNNLYSIALKNEDDETAAGLSKLSTLMRFMLDKSDKTSVKLDEDIEYLKSYIELQKLRFLDDDVSVSFQTEGNTSRFNIPPFLLITFVENAFKHGINYLESSAIDMVLCVEDNRLDFHIKNTNHAKAGRETTKKIGLRNVEKRLELIYGNDYRLSTTSDSGTYSVKLTVKSL